MARGRGGARVPDSPAPVSGPGALSRRTDGGAPALSDTPGNLDYGARRDLETLEQGTGGAGAQGVPGGGGSGAPAGGGPVPAPPVDAFGPTQRPQQPIMTGVTGAQGAAPQLTADQILRMMFRKRPSPWIARMLSGGG